MSTFSESVLNAVQKIPKGSVRTYQEIAIQIGRPLAYRAVGSVLRKNHNYAIPCHRVVLSDYSVGNYNKGKRVKISVLQNEGVCIRKNKVIL